MHLSHGMCGTLCIVRELKDSLYMYISKKVSVFCSYKCVRYRRINRKFFYNIAIFPKSNDVYFNILSLKITATAPHLSAINIHNDRRVHSED